LFVNQNFPMNSTILKPLAFCIFMSTFAQAQKFDLKASIERGKEVYAAYCITCHLEQGEGIESVYPPLAKSDYLMADKKRSIHQVLRGVSGEIKVNKVVYNGEMLGVDLTDAEVSDVLNYVRNSFGNKGDAVTPADVSAVRKDAK
jgi:mono/diheme cytochrome c family protein